MAHRKKGKSWKKGKVDMTNLPSILNVRCCCTPKKILGIIPATFIRDLKVKYFGNEIAIYGDGNDISYWMKQEGFIPA